LRFPAWLALAALGCDRTPPPQSVTLEVTEPVLSGDPVTVVVYAREANGQRTTRKGDLDFSLTPPDLATVTNTGLLTCQKSGDMEVSVDVQGVVAKTRVRCRIVHRIQAADTGRVDIADGAFAPELEVVDAAGKPLGDVPLELTSKMPGTLQVEQAKLVPKDVGRAIVAARAGQATTEFNVDVVRRLKPEALPINQDRSIHFSLDPGKYELVVRLPEEKRVKVEWRGAPYCNQESTARVHTSTCVLRAKGGVVFDNPAWILRAEKAASHEGVELREVP
jgi:hypothetical protein